MRPHAAGSTQVFLFRVRDRAVVVACCCFTRKGNLLGISSRPVLSTLSGLTPTFSCLVRPPSALQDSNHSTSLMQSEDIRAGKQLLRQMYATGTPFWHLLAILVLLLLFYLARIWQRRTPSCSISLRLSTVDNPGVGTSEARFPNDKKSRESRLEEAEQWFRPPTVSSSAVRINEVCLGETLKFDVTSGQLAAMVRGRREEKDIELKAVDQAGHPWLPQPSRSISPPWSNDKDNDVTEETENDSVKFYYRSDIPEIWRRRFLTFLAQ
jgi:hypothetical protein